MESHIETKIEQKRTFVPLQTSQEEIANTITHGIGLLLSFAGLYSLVTYASAHGTAWHVVGCTIYGVSLVFLYMASTMYHCWPCTGTKEVLRIMDHSCIFVLIAGSYTPFTLTFLRGPVGWILLAVVWSMAIIGIGCKIFMKNRFEAETISTVTYLVMGWLVILAIKPVIQNVPGAALVWIGVGGAFYTLGIIFYVRDRKVPFFHAVWHLFVLGGSASHFYAVMNYVLPGQG